MGREKRGEAEEVVERAGGASVIYRRPVLTLDHQPNFPPTLSTCFGGTFYFFIFYLILFDFILSPLSLFPSDLSFSLIPSLI